MQYSQLISIENIFQAWKEFRRGKRNKKDVQIFERKLEDNLFNLHQKLKSKIYRHGTYSEFYVNDPKRRNIHKAKVEDRIVHHLLYKFLYQIFDRTFTFDSYSCRLEKGTHRAIKRLEKFTGTVSKNYSRDCWALKLDIKKFFESVDHDILKDLIRRKVFDRDMLLLINKVINSFCSCHSGLDPESKNCKGIPLGNLTSQVFANIYLNKLDQFVKHKLKVKYYLRYADDFVILSPNRTHLSQYVDAIEQFLKDSLKLELHPKKIIIRKLSWGVDFCGYIVLPHYILPRTKTKRRIFKKVLKAQISNQSLQSYLGYFSHAHSFNLTQNLKNLQYYNGYEYKINNLRL